MQETIYFITADRGLMRSAEYGATVCAHCLRHCIRSSYMYTTLCVGDTVVNDDDLFAGSFPMCAFISRQIMGTFMPLHIMGVHKLCQQGTCGVGRLPYIL